MAGTSHRVYSFHAARRICFGPTHHSARCHFCVFSSNDSHRNGEAADQAPGATGATPLIAGVKTVLEFEGTGVGNDNFMFGV